MTAGEILRNERRKLVRSEGADLNKSHAAFERFALKCFLWWLRTTNELDHITQFLRFQIWW